MSFLQCNVHGAPACLLLSCEEHELAVWMDAPFFLRPPKHMHVYKTRTQRMSSNSSRPFRASEVVWNPLTDILERRPRVQRNSAAVRSHFRRFQTRHLYLQHAALYQQVTTEPRDRQATYEQFCLDVGRLHLEIDGEIEGCQAAEESAVMYTHLLNLFTEESVGLWFAYWCTQTALAGIYQDQLLRLNRHEGCNRSQTSMTNCPPCFTNGIVYHLLDDGRQEVRLHTRFGDVDLVSAQDVCCNGCPPPPPPSSSSLWSVAETFSAGNPMVSPNTHSTDHGASFEEWTIARVRSDDAVLHIQKPFRVVRQRPSESCHVSVCRYMLHVWVPGHQDAIGTYKVLWQQVPL
jgi:hypothetical protein